MKCHEKKRYLTRTDAKSFLKEQERKFPDTPKQKPYFCNCGFWHVYTKSSVLYREDKYRNGYQATKANCSKLIDDIFYYLRK